MAINTKSLYENTLRCWLI